MAFGCSCLKNLPRVLLLVRLEQPSDHRHPPSRASIHKPGPPSRGQSKSSGPRPRTIVRATLIFVRISISGMGRREE
jgi:hypothetical protein